MYYLHKTAIALVTAIPLLFGLQPANATLLNYTIIGDVILGDETDPNAFGLTAGDTITATGVFNDSVLTGGTGTIDFSSGSGNSMTIFVGTETFFASNDSRFGTGLGPSIDLSSFSLSDFDFQAFLGTNGAVADFNSNFTSFDDFDMLFGDWQTTISLTAVPVPAAVWLFGSGLLGLAGVARRNRASA
jgi:hypothetical protein